MVQEKGKHGLEHMATYLSANRIVFWAAQVIVDKWQPTPECDLLSPEGLPCSHRMSHSFFIIISAC